MYIATTADKWMVDLYTRTILLLMLILFVQPHVHQPARISFVQKFGLEVAGQLPETEKEEEKEEEEEDEEEEEEEEEREKKNSFSVQIPLLDRVHIGLTD